MRVAVSRILFVIVFCLLVGACSQQAGKSLSNAPNIVLLTLDTFRADRLAAYGGDPEWTPNLNRLASKGTVFLNAHSAVGTTFPSHATMFTGLYPRYHGVRSNQHTLPNEFRTLAEVLNRHGYVTGGFVSFRQMQLIGNLDQGFMGLSDSERRPGSAAIRDDSKTFQMAVDWLKKMESKDGRPLFLWLHQFQAHGPYEMTSWARKRLGDYSGMLADGASSKELHQAVREILHSKQDLEALRTLYTGEAHAVDERVGRLMGLLRKLGEVENLFLIVVADHGQSIGLNGYLGHGPTLREDVLRVPMFFVDFRHPRSQEIDTLVSLVDLMPTVLDYIGIETKLHFQGRSLAAAIRNGHVEPATYFAEVERKPKPDYGDWYTPNRVAVYANGFKLTYRPGDRPTELFDLHSDPNAQHPLDKSRYPTQMDYLTGLAKDYLSRSVDSVEADLTDEDVKTLKSLGYIQ